MASPAPNLSPKSPEQSDKTKKYDRQLRLWGDHGQAALENSHVCLINASGLGTEILKSLVLPGVGAFTVLDNKKVNEDDLEVNFFLDSECVGKSRAEITTQLLVELNPDVHGDYLEDSVDNVLQQNPNFFQNYTLVIATELNERSLINVSKTLWEQHIPLIHCRSLGFLGSIRVQIREHTIIESHPEHQHPDLRLDKPFPELVEFLNKVNLDEMELKDHAHVPYLIVLYKYLLKWQSDSKKLLPTTFKEKEALREMIRNGKLKNEAGLPEDEENFEEAIQAVNSALNPSCVPSHVREILDDNSCKNITSKSKPFWILAKALRDFVENEGQGLLPLRGSLPDMTAETSRYIALQQLYHRQAIRDADAVYRRALQLLHEVNLPSDTITESDARLFCKHAADLCVMRGTSIEEEYQGKNENLQDIVSEEDPPNNMVLYYVMLRGVDRFHAEYSVYPGELKVHVEPDTVQLKACIGKLLGAWGSGPLAKDDYVHEICRYGGRELHSVSAFIGGCAADEAIKLISKQYKPVNNTFLYDAITSTTATFCF